MEAAATRGTGVEDPMAFLAGTWSTERTLLDRAVGTTGTFSGTTLFTPDRGGLRWDEEGTVRWASFQGPASRSYRIDAGDGGDGGLTVTFPDGRVLCRLDLRPGAARDEHHCAPDTYRVDFVITSPVTIEYSWDVTGPAKDHLLRTVLTRT
ncbi:DUF6314 family protein [Arthrobacter agilis]|uniref:DUF6314 family protein n=1 Tax=Arthrobacter agilis TaxID=37921 RepID=UPI0027881B30|nr:DUF6314 family protein [Arthrobacter agilis]MDQ0735879.1 hypothetical protein [Arthrobacter agilis]